MCHFPLKNISLTNRRSVQCDFVMYILYFVKCSLNWIVSARLGSDNVNEQKQEKIECETERMNERSKKSSRMRRKVFNFNSWYVV